MANKKTTLVRHCKTENGWRYLPAAFAKNGRVRPGWAMVGEEARHYPEGKYLVRYYEGRKIKYKPAGIDAAEALLECNRQATELAATHLANEAGIQVVTEVERKTLSKLATDFYRAAKDRGSEVAAETYELAVSEFLQNIKKTYPDQITPDDILLFQRVLRKRGLSDRTVFNRHSNVKSFLVYCGCNVETLAPKAPAFDQGMPEIYEPEDLRALFAALDDEKDRLTYNLLLQAALREQEAIYLEWVDVIFEQEKLLIRPKPWWGFRVKDKEEREIPLPEAFLKELQAYRNKHPKARLVIGTAKDTPNTHLLRGLKRRARAAGLNCGHCDTCVKHQDPGDIVNQECQRWFLHKFRATGCTQWLRAGLDLRTVQQYMGHKDIESTMRYLRPAENETVRERINAIEWM